MSEFFPELSLFLAIFESPKRLPKRALLDGMKERMNDINQPLAHLSELINNVRRLPPLSLFPATFSLLLLPQIYDML